MQSSMMDKEIDELSNVEFWHESVVEVSCEDCGPVDLPYGEAYEGACEAVVHGDDGTLVKGVFFNSKAHREVMVRTCSSCGHMTAVLGDVGPKKYWYEWIGDRADGKPARGPFNTYEEALTDARERAGKVISTEE